MYVVTNKSQKMIFINIFILGRSGVNYEDNITYSESFLTFCDLYFRRKKAVETAEIDIANS